MAAAGGAGAPRSEPAHVVIVGGGIAGLAAAWELVAGGPGGAAGAVSEPGAGARVRVTVVESASAVGGKLRTSDIAGIPVDEGADAFLARRPEAVALCEEIGMGADELVAPGTGAAWVVRGNRLRPLPGRLALGVPTDLVALARSGAVGPVGVARAALDLVLPAAVGRTPSGEGDDLAIGRLARARLGPAVHERLVDPLIGGINAGRTEDLSLHAVAPQLASAHRARRSLMKALRPVASPPSNPAPEVDGASGAAAANPVFLAPRSGMGSLPARLADALRERGVAVITGTTVTALTPAGDRWDIRTSAGPMAADAVVVATPAWVAAPLLAPVAPAAAAHLRGIAHASVALTTFAMHPAALPAPLEGSGVLVPRPEGRLTTAITFTSTKWPHLAHPDVVLLRASVGRIDDERHEELDDEDLVGRLRVELAALLGLAGTPLAVRVRRWPRSFPQPTPGHPARVAAVRAELAASAAAGRHPALALAGAHLDGVGVPACIGSGRSAARAVLSYLADSAER